MRLETKKYLHDVLQACRKIQQFSKGKQFDDYADDALLRSAVERQFEIIGEALRRLAAEDKATAEQLSEHEKIISFRNILIHGYAEVDNRIVWDVLKSKLPVLLQEVESLLTE